MRHFVHVLVTVALVLSLASPACKFISGQTSLIEICAADGSLKTVAVPDNFNPFKTQKPAEDHEKHKNDPCMFCFAQAHFKPLQAAPVFVPVAESSSFTISAAAFSAPQPRHELGAIAPRAPPFLQI